MPRWHFLRLRKVIVNSVLIENLGGAVGYPVLIRRVSTVASARVDSNFLIYLPDTHAFDSVRTITRGRHCHFLDVRKLIDQALDEVVPAENPGNPGGSALPGPVRVSELYDCRSVELCFFQNVRNS